MRWLITGGCGFIGTSLTRRLLADNSTSGIRIIDNYDIGKPEDLEEVTDNYRTLRPTDINGAPEGLELLEGDVRDQDVIEQAAMGCDVILHLAAHTGVIPSLANPRHDMSVNMLGTFNVLEAARKNAIKKVVIASSGAALGKAPQPVSEASLPNPSSPYGAGKAAAEMYAKAYFHSFGIETSVLRFSNVYGPGSKNKGSVIAKFIKQGIAGNPLTVNGDGGQLRDYIYIDDLLDAIFAAIEKSPGGEVFQIATQIETPVQDIAKEVQKAFTAETGGTPAIINAPALKGDEDRVTADISKARTILGFDPKVRLAQGVSKTLRYFLSAQKSGKDRQSA